MLYSGLAQLVHERCYLVEEFLPLFVGGGFIADIRPVFGRTSGEEHHTLGEWGVCVHGAVVAHDLVGFLPIVVGEILKNLQHHLLTVCKGVSAHFAFLLGCFLGFRSVGAC